MVVAEEGLSAQGAQPLVLASQTMNSQPRDDHAARWGTSVGHTQRSFPKMHHSGFPAIPVPGIADRWYEIQDTVDYWDAFERPKIVWPDISKLPRFSIDTERRYLGNTGFVIPVEDLFLLGVLSSWATWFSISKTAQPLRLRGDRWQYRLFAQFMEEIPIPAASDAERGLIGDLAKKCSQIGAERYELQTKVQRRLITAFGQDDHGASLGELNNKAQAWWELSYAELARP